MRMGRVLLLLCGLAATHGQDSMCLLNRVCNTDRAPLAFTPCSSGTDSQRTEVSSSAEPTVSTCRSACSRERGRRLRCSSTCCSAQSSLHLTRHVSEPADPIQQALHHHPVTMEAGGLRRKVLGRAYRGSAESIGGLLAQSPQQESFNSTVRDTFLR